jgi:pimeloyl-ACP methyl ester carboxylesterase
MASKNNVVPIRSSEAWLDTPSQIETALNENPQETEGFSLPDLSECEMGEIDFRRHKGVAQIAQSKVRWQYRLPEELTRETSIIISHGYGAKAGVYDDMADYLASHGIATATYDAALRQGRLAGYNPKHWDPARLVCQAPWGVIDRKGGIRHHKKIDGPTNKFTIVGHSMGVRTAVKNAQLHPEDIDTIIGIDGAGITEGDNFVKYLERMPHFFKDEYLDGIISGDISPTQAAKISLGGFVYFASSLHKALAQGVSIGNSNIKSDIKGLREIGVNSALIVSPADTLVPADNAEAAAGEHTDTADVFVRLPNEELGHLGPLRQPGIYGQTVLSLIKYFDKKTNQNVQKLARAA